jgi:hypothetical protein
MKTRSVVLLEKLIVAHVITKSTAKRSHCVHKSAQLGPVSSQIILVPHVSFWDPFLVCCPEVGSCYPHAVCISVNSPINFWIPEQIFMKLGMYVMAPEPISTAHLIILSHQSVCLYAYPRISLLRSGSVDIVPMVTNTCNNRWIVGDVVFYVVRLLSQ